MTQKTELRQHGTETEGKRSRCGLQMGQRINRYTKETSARKQIEQLRSSAISKSTRKSQTPGTEQKSAARQKRRRKTQIQMLQRIMKIVQHTYDPKE
jgi:hypothetical protein